MKGRNIMMGYLEDLAKTNEAVNQDGFLKSGDLGTNISEIHIFYITQVYFSRTNSSFRN